MPEYQWLGPVRGAVRAALFKVLRQTLQTDDGRRILADALSGMPIAASVSPRLDTSPPYPDLPPATSRAASDGPAPIIVTGRFRSGSTLLWNLFRQLPGHVSYYEPLNERRWFDPSARGDRVDSTHVGVEDYWREYQGLEDLSAVYREEWIHRRLYMPADAWDPGLKRYIDRLIEAASPKRAVLQFNRVDFRLPWLRRHYPQATFIHIYRHPRDQWTSSLVDVDRFPRDGSIDAFAAHDNFYLLSWARDLAYSFPLLDPRSAGHPYRLFYLIWRLSYQFGRRYCDHSVSLEDLCREPAAGVSMLMNAAGVSSYDAETLTRVIVPQKPKWHRFADDAWFATHERVCERQLAEFQCA